MRRVVKRVLLTLGIIVGVVVALIGGLYAALWLALELDHTIAKSDGPNGLQMEFIETESAILFGPSNVRLVLKENGKKSTSVDLVLANDGKSLDEANWNVSWLSDGADVLLTVEEQSDMVCRLQLTGGANCQHLPKPEVPINQAQPPSAPATTETEPAESPAATTPTSPSIPLTSQIAADPQYITATQALKAVADYLNMPVVWDLDAKGHVLGILSESNTVSNSSTYTLRDVIGISAKVYGGTQIIRVKKFSSSDAPAIDDSLVAYYEVADDTQKVTEIG